MAKYKKKPTFEKCKSCGTIIKATCPICKHPMSIYENQTYFGCLNCDFNYHVE